MRDPMNITWSLPGHSSGGRINDVVLSTPLPADREYKEAGLSYGDYVCAVEAVLESDGGRVVTELMAALFPGIHPGLCSIHVEILKHGQFYHPSRMTLFTTHGSFPLVINLAVTPEGGGCAHGEFALLGSLGYRSEALPRVYALETVEVSGQKVVLFFGEWFEGYHEFHQTQRVQGDGVVVWGELGDRHLTKGEETEVYRQTAEILTRLYNPLTFEMVQPWHHAAGDFVVNCDGDLPSVRLITVRQYTPMAEVEEAGAEEYLEGALFFLLLLSIRNRLDRFDGIGEVAWVGDHCVAATIAGFFDGLSGCGEVGPLSGPFGARMEGYLTGLCGEDLREMAGAVVASFNPQAREMGVVTERLCDHVTVFIREIQVRAETRSKNEIDTFVH